VTNSLSALQSTIVPSLPAESLQPGWYALHTRARHEKHVAHRLQSQGISTFLPLVNELHRWSDRKKIVQVPLFSCYVFANVALSPEVQAKVLKVDGILRFVGPRGEAMPVAEAEIEMSALYSEVQLTSLSVHS
jgi:transcription antitermination factor NusG